jgi:hypothetical protein
MSWIFVSRTECNRGKLWAIVVLASRLEDRQAGRLHHK